MQRSRRRIRTLEAYINSLLATVEDLNNRLIALEGDEIDPSGPYALEPVHVQGILRRTPVPVNEEIMFR